MTQYRPNHHRHPRKSFCSRPLLLGPTLAILTGFLLSPLLPAGHKVFAAEARGPASPSSAQGAQTQQARPAAAQAQAQNQPHFSPLPAPRPGWSFPPRQTLTYAVDWRVFPAGTATVHLESEGDTQRVTVVGDSAGAINLLFRVSDRFQSSFNRNTGCSASFSKQLMEGRRQVSSDQKFSYGQLTSTYDERNLISHIHRTEHSAIPPCATDLLSAMFLVAAQPLQLDQRIHIPVADAGHVTDVTLHVEAHEAVPTPTTTYQTLRVQATADAGIVKRRGNIWIWYTDDARHIPVQMRARLFWGTLTFRLTGIEQK